MKVMYQRVSTHDQDFLSQSKNANNFDGLVLSEKVSGAIPFFERNQGKKIKELVEQGKVKELYVFSLDRLGRGLLDILKTIQFLTEHRCNVILEREGIRTLNENGEENLASKLLINILGAVAQTERELILERQREGIANAKKRGKYKGRKKGSGMTREELISKHKKVAQELMAGESLRRAAAIGGVSLGTAQRVNRALNLRLTNP